MTWTKDHLPPGPYLHGTRARLTPGTVLRADVINNMPGTEDDRTRVWATTDLDRALDWALRRGLREGGETLYAYEVELVDPEVDVNMHHPERDEPITEVMAPSGRVVRVAVEMSVVDYVSVHPEARAFMF